MTARSDSAEAQTGTAPPQGGPAIASVAEEGTTGCDHPADTEPQVFVLDDDGVVSEAFSDSAWTCSGDELQEESAKEERVVEAPLEPQRRRELKRAPLQEPGPTAKRSRSEGR